MNKAPSPNPLPQGERELEELLVRLEELVGRLADQGAPLDRLVADYEQACQLLNLAELRLDAATRRMQALQPAIEDGAYP
jgi:exodeoxyribonuclease VII small subunit